jgi:hypothetical protein
MFESEVAGDRIDEALDVAHSLLEEPAAQALGPG